MKTLIIYRGTNGCTARIAREIGARITGEVDYCDIKDKRLPDLGRYERVIIGGNVSSGRVQKKVTEFCIRNQDVLLDKLLGLYLCSIRDSEAAREYYRLTFPEALRQHARSMLFAGGSVDVATLNFLGRLALGKSLKARSGAVKIDFPAVERFSRKMDRTFQPIMLLV